MKHRQKFRTFNFTKDCQRLLLHLWMLLEKLKKFHKHTQNKFKSCWPKDPLCSTQNVSYDVYGVLGIVVKLIKSFEIKVEIWVVVGEEKRHGIDSPIAYSLLALLSEYLLDIYELLIYQSAFFLDGRSLLLENLQEVSPVMPLQFT
ncbi:CLUMA_CG018875, isoform A [Clunio marinus]|uniref:CLUMA_CG018875, isoform A n=1 Tax=Clunio marinus TaxID=568069 RepID=A0A1J1J4P7_9DIPT|nr:CLUMA_CG018875, isoform A [Clunio marinus]